MEEFVIVPYDARLVANYFLQLGQSQGAPISPLKMQKLVYLAHGWNLALRGQPLISNSIQAWRYGPVVPELYQDFKKYRASGIEEAAPVQGSLDDDSKALIAAVWNRYGHYSGIQLSTLTHEKGYAWDVASKMGDPFFTPNIPDSLIADEFQRRRQQG
jgi:uncharacterized phage-associated protein